MTYKRINFRKLVGLPLGLLVTLTSTAAFAQPQPGEMPSDEGISSYIFSPGAVTVVLVLLLIGQLVYRYRVRQTTRVAPVALGPSANQQPNQVAKKRYDRDEISTLLKASAASKNSGRTLEEAIRMTQEAQADLMEILDVHVVEEDRVAHHFKAREQSVVAEPESVKAEPQSVDANSVEGVKTLK